MRDQSKRKKAALEPIGQRIARLRTARGWTQQNLAERLAISRVAVSHIEMALSTPSERTITLLAGLFKTPPHELVAGTTYPAAKGEKLPHVVCCFTSLEMELALFENDLTWVERLAHTPECRALAGEIFSRWSPRLEYLAAESFDESDRTLTAAAREKLQTLKLR